MGPIIKLLRRAGAKEVHVRVASPPLRFPCYMGINIPTKEELIANTLSSKELAEKVGLYLLFRFKLQLRNYINAFHFPFQSYNPKSTYKLNVFTVSQLLLVF